MLDALVTGFVRVDSADNTAVRESRAGKGRVGCEQRRRITAAGDEASLAKAAVPIPWSGTGEEAVDPTRAARDGYIRRDDRTTGRLSLPESEQVRAVCLRRGPLLSVSLEMPSAGPA
jgi:hypothetical protein